MRTFSFTPLVRIIFILGIFITNNALAQITVNNPKKYLCPGGDFVPLETVIISENLIGDFNNTGSSKDSVILSRLSPNFKFQPGPLTLVEIDAGTSGNSETAYATDTTIVFKYTLSNTNNGKGRFELSGIKVKALAADSAAIKRFGGNAAMTGLVNELVFFTLVGVNNHPSVSTDPSPATVCEGSPASFTVAATGQGLGYRWQGDSGGGFADLTESTAFSGVASASLTVNTTDGSLNGMKFRNIVQGVCSSDTSAAAVLTVHNKPVIQTNPSNITACENFSAEFSVEASGTGLSYQWQSNQGSGFSNLNSSATITGVQSDTLRLANLPKAYNNYKYRVIIKTADQCETISPEASLTIHSKPVITGHPADKTICANANTTFQISATGENLSYTWQKLQDGLITISNGGDFSNATTNSLSVNTPAKTLDQAKFRAYAKNTCGTDTSSYGTLDIPDDPVIVTQPQMNSLCLNTTNAQLFSVMATGDGLSYKWHRKGGNLNDFIEANDNSYIGQRTAVLSDPKVDNYQNGYIYKVEITNQCGVSVMSNEALLIVTNSSATITGLKSSYCPNDPADTVIAFPDGGSFSGSGFTVDPDNPSRAIFNPSAVAPNANYSLTYTFVNGSCNSSDTKSTNVKARTEVNITAPADNSVFAKNSEPVSLTANPAGGVFTSSDQAAISFSNNVYRFTPSQASQSSLVFYTYNAANGCTFRDTITLKITSLPLGVSYVKGLKVAYCSEDSPEPISWIYQDSIIGGITSYPLISITGPGVTGSKENGYFFDPHIASLPENGGSGIKNITVSYSLSFGGFTYGPYFINQSTVVHLNPKPTFETVNPVNNQTLTFKDYYCSYDNRLKLSGNYPGSDFTIYDSNNNQIYKGDSLSPSYIRNKAIKITYRYTDPNSQCYGEYSRNTVVTEEPPVPATNPSVKYCVKDEILNLTATAKDINHTIKWYNGANEEIGTGPSFATGISNLIKSTNTFYVLQEHKASGCLSKTQGIQFNVYELPTLAITGNLASYCIDWAKDTLSGIGPPAGTFAGPGITNIGNNQAIFDPASFSTAAFNQKIRFWSTNSDGCTDTTAVEVDVHALPEVSIAVLDSAYCMDPSRPAIPLSGSPAGGDYYMNGEKTLSSFKPSDLSPGEYTFRYEYRNSTTQCVNDVSVTTRINPLPVVDFSLSSICQNDTISLTNLSYVNQPDQIEKTIWTFDGKDSAFSFNETYSFNTFGNKSIHLKTITGFNCVNSKTSIINIEPYPVIKFRWEDICHTDSTGFKDLSTIIQPYIKTLYSWNFGDGDTLTGIGNIALGKHNDHTSGTYSNPYHKYRNPGLYPVSFTVQSAGGCSASLDTVIHILPVYQPGPQTPYVEDFENGNFGFVAYGENNSWKLGTPEKPVLKGAHSGVNAWSTGLSTLYNNNEKSYIDFPCFILNDLERPMVSMSYYADLQKDFDGVVLQYSVNGGRSWENTGEVNEGLNWHNGISIIANPGNQTIVQRFEGWTGNHGSSWKTARSSLDNIRDFGKTVRFRMAFGSDATNPPNSQLEGFAFDNLKIMNRERLVLFEKFTNSSTGTVLAGDAHIDQMITKKPKDAVGISYHTSFPGYDPFNAANSSDPSAKVLFYGISQVPAAVIDGNAFTGHSSGASETLLEKRYLTDPGFNIDLNLTKKNGSVDVTAEITSRVAIPSDHLILNIAVVERFASEVNGDNGQSEHHWVLKKLLPDAAGTSYFQAWNPGQSVTVTKTWNLIPQAFDTSQIGIIAFVQNNRTKEIYQAAIIKGSGWSNPTVGTTDPIDITGMSVKIYPNPAESYTILTTSESGTENISWVLTDQLGRTAGQGSFKAGDRKTIIPVEDLKAGIYLIKIQSGERSVVEKLIIR